MWEEGPHSARRDPRRHRQAVGEAMSAGDRVHRRAGAALQWMEGRRSGGRIIYLVSWGGSDRSASRRRRVPGTHRKRPTGYLWIMNGDTIVQLPGVGKFTTLLSRAGLSHGNWLIAISFARCHAQ